MGVCGQLSLLCVSETSGRCVYVDSCRCCVSRKLLDVSRDDLDSRHCHGLVYLLQRNVIIMPLVALNPPSLLEETQKEQHKNIGSFRDVERTLTTLPDDIAKLRDADIDWNRFTLDPTVSHLNHAAFGGVPQEYVDLENALRLRANRNPSLFYDTLCIPLIRESIAEAEDFFNGPVILQPNCTSALKNIIAILGNCSVACLSPIYGATLKLLQTTHPHFTNINPGLFCESDTEIIHCLEQAYETTPFTVLLADHISSQSGRLLPMSAVVTWCAAHDVITVIDGTQVCSFDNDIWPDYYVLSTHKWLCNIKTCCVVRINPPRPPPPPIGISFGYDVPTDRHVWTGMLDYIPYILLAKVLRVYRKHGADMVKYSASLLTAGLQRVGCPVLGGGKGRVIAMVPTRRPERDLQASLEKFGVFVSVKLLPVEAGRWQCTSFLRVSAWCYNSMEDFDRLGDTLNYTLRIDNCFGQTAAEKSLHMRMMLWESLETQFNLTEMLFGQLSVSAFFTRAEPLRHPLVFYYGHTAVFFINKLVLGMFLDQEDRIDPVLESLCAVGVDEMSWDDLNIGEWDKVLTVDQPATLQRVRDYRRIVLGLLHRLIMDPDRELSLPVPQESIWWVLLMGLEHDRIHFETSQAIMAQLPLSLLSTPCPLWDIFPPPSPPSSSREAIVNALITVKGGVISAGRSPSATTTFGWDNEFGRGKEVHLRDFQVSQTLVSNDEYVAFIEEGGYRSEALWSSAGWQWAQNKSYPLFWKVKQGEGGDKVKFRSLLAEIDMPADWPVVVNNFEAEAFCAWKSKKLGKVVRMISHPEWLLLSARAKSVNYNLNFRMGGGPVSVRKCGEALGAMGETIYDIRGNLWQHSRSLLTVPPEFKVHPLYDDFTLPTIDGHHNFILGGSWASVGNCASVEGRYGFRRHFYQFAGIRYVCSDNEDLDVPARLVTGEVAMQLDENYMDFTDPVLLSVPPCRNGMEAFGRFAAQYVAAGSSVIVLNGSVGRVTAEIVAHSRPSRVLHTDLTANSLDAFLHLLEHSCVRFERTIEGSICRTECVNMSPEWAKGFADTEIAVKQLDLFRMTEATVSTHDVAVLNLAQLSCVVCPRRGEIPRDLHLLVRPGGLLIVLRPLAENRQDNAPLVVPGFVDIGQTQIIPHIIRETRRKHRFSESQCSVFQRTRDTVDITASDTAASVSSPKESCYEQSDVLRSYENLHYTYDTLYGIKNFPVACAALCLEACRRHNVSLGTALDAGCGPGRLSK